MLCNQLLASVFLFAIFSIALIQQGGFDVQFDRRIHRHVGADGLFRIFV
jgi:hypothetical protein